MILMTNFDFRKKQNNTKEQPIVSWPSCSKLANYYDPRVHPATYKAEIINFWPKDKQNTDFGS